MAVTVLCKIDLRPSRTVTVSSRCLFQVDELEDYVQKSDDVALLKWWAAYLESTERFDKARKYYGKAGDYLSLVRIACFQVSASVLPVVDLCPVPCHPELNVGNIGDCETNL